VSKSRDFRKRLDALNRQPLPQGKGSAGEVEDIRRRLQRMRREAPPPQAILYRRDIPRGEGRPARPRRPAGPPLLLEEAAQGTDVESPDGGTAYLVVERIEDRGEEWAALCGVFRDALARADSGLRRRIAAGCGVDDVAPADVIFLDLESTGLAGTPLFLVGTMVWEDEGLVVRQYFARDYSEERAVISLFLGVVARKKLLVSFNGKSFDLPYVRVRAAANGLPFEVNLAHFDLLHECRRIWRHVLPDCRLQTLESRICGRYRHSDIPGAEIPDAYHEFVRTGNAAEVVEILDHNLLDLATLADLMVHLPAPG
jgi:uncharacterized protein YprB with RNaseH-like and TPR domain